MARCFEKVRKIYIFLSSIYCELPYVVVTFYALFPPPGNLRFKLANSRVAQIVLRMSTELARFRISSGPDSENTSVSIFIDFDLAPFFIQLAYMPRSLKYEFAENKCTNLDQPRAHGPCPSFTGSEEKYQNKQTRGTII